MLRLNVYLLKLKVNLINQIFIIIYHLKILNEDLNHVQFQEIYDHVHDHVHVHNHDRIAALGNAAARVPRISMKCG